MNLAILSFNRGAKSFVSLAETLGIKLGLHCTTHFNKCDVFRIQRAENKQSDVEQKRRQAEQRHKAAAEERLRRHEGTTYKAGGF